MIISNTAVKRPVFATMLITAMIIFGLISLGKLPLDRMPNIDMPIVTIQTILPGADPETVETEITDKIEEAVNTIEGMDKLRSNSLEGISLVVCEFELEKDIDVAIQDVRDKLARIKTDLPDQSEEPLVEKLDFGSIPVITLAVSGKDTTNGSAAEQIRYITEYVDNNIKERLQTIKGVGSVKIIGGQEREIRIWLDAEKMRGYNIPVDIVKNVLASENLEVPGGRIETLEKETVVKTYGKLENVEEFNDLIITYVDGKPVYMRDIGYVEDGMEDLRSISYMDGKRAVSVEIRKVSGGNVVQVADDVKEVIADIENNLPDDIEMTMAIDNSIFVKHAINDVSEQMFIGGMLAVITILFFLRNFRTAFIAAIVLPSTVFSTYNLMNAFGFTLNQLTMLALTISIGMLVDDAVVMIENIYHKLERGEMNPKKAAMDAAKEIGMAIITTSATILGVFVPVAFMTGIIGRFFFEFGLTVAFATMISTFISLTLTPMLCSRILRGRKEGEGHNIIYRTLTKGFRAMDAGYKAVLGFALHHRFITVIAAIAIFYGSLQLAALIPGEFTPPEDDGRFLVGIEAPLGSSIYETRNRAQEVERVIKTMPGINFTYLSAGGGSEGKVNEASIVADIVDLEERDFSQIEMINAVRAKLAGKFPDLTLAVGPLEQGGGSAFSSYEVNYSLRGSNMQELINASNLLKGKLEAHGGFVDVTTTYDEAKPEVGVRINREKAADLGASVGGIAFAINTLVAGEDITTFEKDGEQYDVRVRLMEKDRDEADDIKKILVMTNSGQTTELSNLVSVSDGFGPVQIDRRDRMREISIMANLGPDLTLGQAITAIDQFTEEANLPSTVYPMHSGMSEVMQESFESMSFSLMLAIVIIYMVLASLFESFIHPFTIMMSLPLSIAGAMGALLLADKTLNILSMIGIIMLMGLVTKNAILLIDYTIQLRNQGKNRKDALLEAAPRRLRPILMTTISTIAGSVPVALGIGAGAAFRSSMGVAVIGGMVTSTLLTLLVVPVVYTLMDDLTRLRLPAWLTFWKKKPAKAEETN